MKFRQIYSHQVLFLFIALIIASCASQKKQHVSAKHKVQPPKEQTQAEVKVDVKQLEKSSPAKYLVVDSTSMTALGVIIPASGSVKTDQYKADGFMVTGKIKNASTSVKYKDLKLALVYLSNTGTELGSQDFAVNDVITPNSSKTFQVHVYPPKTLSSYSITVMKATPTE